MRKSERCDSRARLTGIRKIFVEKIGDLAGGGRGLGGGGGGWGGGGESGGIRGRWGGLFPQVPLPPLSPHPPPPHPPHLPPHPHPRSESIPDSLKKFSFLEGGGHFAGEQCRARRRLAAIGRRCWARRCCSEEQSTRPRPVSGRSSRPKSSGCRRVTPPLARSRTVGEGRWRAGQWRGRRCEAAPCCPATHRLPPFERSTLSERPSPSSGPRE